MVNAPRRFLSLIGLLLLSSVLSGCGGTTQTSPSATTPPASTTPVTGGVAVTGTLAGFYNSSTRFSGSTATMSTSPASIALTTAAGTFQFAGVAPGTYTLTFVGPDHIDRAVSVQIIAGGANDLGTIDAVERTVGTFQFNVAMADQMIRGSFAGNNDVITARWVTQPTVYVDLDSLEPHQSQVFYPPIGACPTPTGRLLDTIRDAVNVKATDLVGRRLAPTLVEVRPSSAMPPDWTPGVINVRGGHLESPAAGYADLKFNSRYEIYAGVIVLGTSDGAGGPGTTDRTVMLHELGHTFGRGHSRIDQSIMGERGFQACVPSVSDLKYGEYHYRRPAGTRSPDDTTRVETIQGRLSSPF